ncbi:cell division protein FtsZ [Alphaproteobacteria bacterium LSUCC0684]
MTLNISVPTSTQELRPKITVVGVGGGGGNAVNNMIAANLEGVDFLVANTDGQALASSLCARKIQLGRQHTQGLGAGSKPEIGRIAAEESIDDIMAELADSHMVFITAGMGGGTGTGAAPVIARACRERGILTVGVITKPFDFEGQVRMKQAIGGIEELQAYVDTLIVIPNQNLFRLANERTTFADAFAMADEVLHQGVCGVTDLMIKPGMINLDFADIRAVMSEMGKAMMGTGEASGENRATSAAEAAINNPLLDETTMKGAQAVLINITGGTDMTLFEVDEAANHIRREVDADATIIFGSALDEKLDGIMRVSVVATGMEAEAMMARPPQPAPDHRPSFTPAPLVRNLTGTRSTALAGETVAKAESAAAPMAAAPMMETSAMATAPMEAEETLPPQPLTPSVSLDPGLDPDAPAMAEAADQPFSLSSIPPHAEDHEEDETQETETGLSDDPDQGSLMDMVTAAPETTSSGDDTAAVEPETGAEKPFVLGRTVEISDPEPAQPSGQGNGSLISHISRMFSGKSAAATEQAAAPKSGETSPREPILSPIVKTDTAETQAAKAEQPVDSGIAALKPTPQSQFDMPEIDEEDDLEIPAFLRRQAN